MVHIHVRMFVTPGLVRLAAKGRLRSAIVERWKHTSTVVLGSPSRAVQTAKNRGLAVSDAMTHVKGNSHLLLRIITHG